MQRTKPPVLTSPWKIGFFVSLMLVFVSIGVAYYFMRTFSLSWGISAFEPSLQWLQSEVWTPITNGEGFLVLMSPLLGLVGVTALLSYIVITQAVRKYKRYLDSGADYKNLLASIQDIDDIEAKGQVEKLKNHPELKSFLGGIRDRLATRTRELDEREKALENRVQTAEQKKEEELTKRFGDECKQLVDAIQRGIGNLPEELGLTMLELQRIEEALRQSAKSKEEPGDLSESNYQVPFVELRQTSEMMKGKIAEVAKELTEGRQGAKQIEKQLSELLGSGPGGEVDVAEMEKQMQAIRGSSKTMDSLSTTLGLLGEEAKGIAINTALQAGSGRATQKDMVQLAEDLKAIAARFTELSKSYVGATGKVKTAANQLSAHWSQIDPGTASDSSVESIASKVSLWVERIVVLSDKLNSLKDTYDRELDSVPTIDSSIDPSTGSATSDPSDSFQVEDYGFQTLDNKPPIFSDEADSEAGIPGIEKDERGIFQEISSDDEDMFADLATDAAATDEDSPEVEGQPRIDEDSFRGRNTIDELIGETPPSAAKPEPETPQSAPSEVDFSGFKVESNEFDTEREETPDSVPQAEKVAEKVEDDVIDLYALGAIDYDPAVHS